MNNSSDKTLLALFIGYLIGALSVMLWIGLG